MMINDVLDLFRKGKEAKNAVKQKQMAALSPVIGTLIAAAFKVAGDFHYAPPITVETAVQIATGVAAAWLWVTNLTSTGKIGLLPAKPDAAPATVADPRTEQARVIATSIGSGNQDTTVVRELPVVPAPVPTQTGVGRSLTDIQDPTGFQSGG